LEVFLVHPGGPLWPKKDKGAWTIPKGENEPDENPLVAARIRRRDGLSGHRRILECPAFYVPVSVRETGAMKGGPKLTATGMDPANPAETLKPGFLRQGPGKAAGAGSTTGILAEVLERELGEGAVGVGRGRIVVDKTNLTGRYDWTLHWAPWQELPGGEPPDPNAPSLFTALQEQLGLKLEPAKGQVEVVVSDHGELPSEN